MASGVEQRADDAASGLPPPVPAQSLIDAAERIGPAAPRQATTASAGLDFRRLGAADMVCGGAALVVLISLFLPWYSEPVSNTTVTLSALDSPAGGWRLLVLILSLATIGYLVARTATESASLLPLPHWQVLTIATGANLFFVVLAFLVHPAYYPSGSGGAALGVFAAVVAVVAASWTRVPSPLAEGVVAVSPEEGGAPVPPMRPHGDESAAIPHAPSVCSNCGAALEPGNQFCTSCGTPRP